MSTTHEINFAPNPVQKNFIESRAKADLYSSRMGEGKSAGIAWAVFYHTQQNPGATWAIIRDTWENLRATTLKEMFKWFPPGLCGDWNESRKTFTWRLAGFDNATVQFLGMDDPGDASKLQSRELAGFAIDEPAPAAESGGVAEMIFDVAMSRLRQPGMNWYAAKLAQNNSDETHWTYRRFVDPGHPDFACWQPTTPENTANLPPSYYEGLRDIWAHRPDLVARFVEGNYGYMQIGNAVTPEFDPALHLANALSPIKGAPLTLCWDFGLNPTCIITQVTPLGQWLVLEDFVGDGIGVLELIKENVKDALAARYSHCIWNHVGDPAGAQREQSSANITAVRVIRRELGGNWRPGPVKPAQRIDPLRAVLTRTVATNPGRRGMVQVDRVKAKNVAAALRGGWHYNVARTGLVSSQPVKDIHSHPGDALGYGAARLFPLGKLQDKKTGKRRAAGAKFFGTQKPGLGFEQPGRKLPPKARKIGVDI